MDNSQKLLNILLESFSQIKDLVSNTEDIEKCTKEITENGSMLRDVIESSKTLVDKLFEHSDNLKKSFYKVYAVLGKPDDHVIEDVPVKDDANVIEAGKKQTLNGYKPGEETRETTSSDVQNDPSIQEKEVILQEHVDNVDIAEDKSENEKPHDLKETNTELVDPDATLLIETNLENKCPETEEHSENELDEDNENEENDSEAPKSLIRVIDLNKLIDPKPKKSVKFDSSVIILTSSDEDSSSPSKRKSNSTEQHNKLRSALKNSSPKNKNETDSDSTKSKHEILNKKKDDSLTDMNKVKKEKCTKTSESEKENSNSDSEKNENKMKNKVGIKQIENHESDPDTGVTEKSKAVTSKHKSNSDSENEDNDSGKRSDSEHSDSAVQSRKSKRLRNINKQHLQKREKLKKIFRRNSDKSFSIAENSKKLNDQKAPMKRNSKKKLDIVEVLTDTSSLSDDIDKVEQNTTTATKSSKKKSRNNASVDEESDDKFGRKVYVPLPLIECEKLKEVYFRNKEILEIRSLTRLGSIRRAKRIHRRDSKSSSDSEKPKTKKSKNKKTIVAEADSSDEKEGDSSDDEPLAKKIVPEDTTEPVAGADGDEIIADIAMEQSKSADDDDMSKDSSDEENTDSIKSTKKTEKKTIDSKQDKEKSKGLLGEDSVESSKDDTTIDETAKELSKKQVQDKDLSESETSVEDKKTDGGDDVTQDSEKEKKKKKDWKKDKLLTEKLDSTDSEGEFSKYCTKKDKSKSEIMSDEEIQPSKIQKRKARKRVVVDSDDSDEQDKRDKKEKKRSESSNESSQDEDKKSSSNSESEEDEEKKDDVKKKPSRRRIKRTKDDSSSSDDDKSTRKQIRKVLDRDSLSETTKKAEAQEKERKARIAEKQKKYNCYFEEKMDATIEKLVLEYDDETKDEVLTVNKKIAKKLKPHQANGIQFMWDACFESLKRATKTSGSGCILAHCMGLGKTLQVVALTHTLLKNNEQTKVNKVMVVCPLNTVLNWKNEFKKWVPSNAAVDVYELITSKKNYEKQYVVKEWHEEGGVLIIGYQMFRNLSNPDNKRISKKTRMIFYEGMVDPGPDLVVCDEGHLLKNEKTSLTIAMNRIKTARRIVLTGTPLQNNLKEYWCMVQFIKPNLLGTYKEYLNRFVNPIINGQYTDSTQHDILLMRKRSHVLHKLLDGVVQRRDYAVLEPYLPPKFEYVLFVNLTETQVKLYKHYMDRYARQNDGSNRTSFLFTDFQQLQRICTHPRVLKDKSSERREKDYDDEEESEGSLKDFIDDGDATSEESAKSTSSGSSDEENGDSTKKNKSKSKSTQKVRVTRAQAAQRRDNNEDSDPELVEIKKEWWQDYCDGDELDNINNSGKLILLFEILRECEEIGDKILVFSQSLYTLNCIEHFLEKIDEATQEGNSDKVGGHKGSWALGLDYFRLDGSSSSENRSIWCDTFNNPNNLRSRLFLISTKAGGLGINLVAANRVIIFDVSWNPSHDVQSIYRVYRFGQTKPSYIYRFVTYGTMEMKIYERQVTKQAISKRVIDEQQIDRHYNQNDLQELYKCDLEPTDRPIPMVPKDVLLGELLQKHENRIYKYHLHQSLLENKEAEGLNEEERKAAWDEFENEKVIRKYNYGTNIPNLNPGMSAQAIAGALTNIVRKDNPNWSEVQIKGIIPALVQQLQVQLQENDTTMYNRVLQEIQLMRMEKMREAYYQNQMMRMIQHQQKQNAMAGNLNVNPVRLAQFLTQRPTNYFGEPSSANPNLRQNDVIELND
ncbi:unnamed protein product [Phaedon cochleariae]|uniref:Transcriptional regulator ATRX homolog n=1 Tax=Phaedon cochleariae TaxID=80249 RepID=A0A9P0GHJ5_PHACE|nr:unnamed protein product [Phaedon cochleariae]